VYAFEFRLTFAQVRGQPALSAEGIGRALLAAGCGDVVVDASQGGRLVLEFIEPGDMAEEAVFTAVEAACSALPGAVLAEASPDLVGLSDIAALLGVSRQNMRQVLLGDPVLAPPPVHAGAVTIWRLAAVLDWLRAAKGYPVDGVLVDLARATMRVNLDLSIRDAELTLADDARVPTGSMVFAETQEYACDRAPSLWGAQPGYEAGPPGRCAEPGRSRP
jgi:hypothetical protein